MFRNLARRNQSLLQRQLTVLDDMERRATDPDVLEDLFKMDHLTTRMRRHAEGLIILSGAPPGRSWSAPVKLIDVMRGAVAEVEDYARVTTATQSPAALAGSAVTDVIHLLAELIENATSLSPPFTQVRVSGETVANGFAIEIEDRGLGMVPERLQELNERLANPPDINPANTEQLGLFVVGQLARRHGIRVVLHPSPYSGITAVAVIPSALIVEEGPAAITAGGRAPAAAGSSADWSSADGPRGSSGTGSYSDGPYSDGYAGATSGLAGRGQPDRAAAANGWPVSTGRDGLAETAGTGTNGRMQAAGGYFTPSAGPETPADPGGYGAEQDPLGPPIRISGVLRHPSATSGFSTLPGPADPASATAGGGTKRRRHSTEEVPVVTDVPVSPPVAPPAPSFDVFTPIQRPRQDGAPAAAPDERPYPDFGAPAAGGGYPTAYDGVAGTAAYPGDSAYQDNRLPDNRLQDSHAYPVSDPYSAGLPYPAANPYAAGTPYADGPGSDGNGVADPAAAGGTTGNPAAGGDQAADGAGDFQELPRRVRQASLAPQLRAPAAASAAPGAAAVPPVPAATAASLTDMRNTLSAMQRGWQQGRSQTQQDTKGQADGS
jgi:hypothetical protein